MSQPNDTSDLETLELYLDRELDAGAAARVDARLAGEPALRSRLERLRRQRAVRLEAMSTAFDTDAASIERLVASVRDARAAEIADGNRSRWRIFPAQIRSYAAAAACLAVGLFIGGQLQRQQNGSLGGRVDTPTMGGGAGLVENASLNFAGGEGGYAVTLYGVDGQFLTQVHCNSLGQAQQFVQLMKAKSASGQTGPIVGEARIGKLSY